LISVTALWPLPPYPSPGNFQAVYFFPRLIFGGSLGNDAFQKKRDGEAREVASQAAVGGSATIWGPSRASEAALVTHLDGLRGLTPAPNRGAATDRRLGSKRASPSRFFGKNVSSEPLKMSLGVAKNGVRFLANHQK